MKAIEFPEANTRFGPPSNLVESQVQIVPAYQGQVQGGSCDGLDQVVVAYQFTPEELAHLSQWGGKVFVTWIGVGLPPHYLSFDFHQATHPA